MAKDFDEGEKMRRWVSNTDNPERLLKQIGILMVSESQGSFKAQQFGKIKWPSRGPVNVFGILADLSNGKIPPQRRFERRPALVDTGRLRSTIAFRTVGKKEVEIGSNLDYSGVLNFGGTSESVPITDAVAARLYRWIKTKPKDVKRELGWLFNRKFRGKTLKTEIPARKFVGFSQQTVKDIDSIVAPNLFGDN